MRHPATHALLSKYPELRAITVRPRRAVERPHFTTKRLAVHIIQDDLAALDALATRNKCKRAEMVRRIIHAALDGASC